MAAIWLKTFIQIADGDVKLRSRLESDACLRVLCSELVEIIIEYDVVVIKVIMRREW
jgi:hypothetical protein